MAVALDADLLVLLTNVDGLLTANPAVDPTAQRVSELAAIDDAALARALGDGSAGGTGGMASKLEAARLCVAEGTAAVIANGTVPGHPRSRAGRRGRGHVRAHARAAAPAPATHRRLRRASRGRW